MEPLARLDSKSILSEEIFLEIFDQEDEITKARMILSLTDRAGELGVKKKFEELLKAYKRVDKEAKQRERKKPITMLDKWTNFEGPYNNMFCGAWIAGEDGVYAQNDSQVDAVACYHPILPVERMKNLETGEEQIKIAYKRNGRWDEIIVPKTMVTSASKIVALSGRGISVTSENAKLLVRFLSDVENMNDSHIKVQYSTSKLGWIKDQFIPYDTEIVFDGDQRFRQAYESVSERGNWKIWQSHMLKLRKTKRLEIKFMMAASFASVLVSLLGGLPFIVDLWGETEGGKTVSLMVATSIWANPDESAYIGDFKTTEVALEAKADMLNHLPMVLDDTSKTSSRIRDNFEGMVYDMCSGKGKSRSNKELGISRENRWKNCILTNGERPLNSYVSQGGAINRILEVECNTWREDVVTTATKAGAVVTLGATDSLYDKIMAEDGVIAHIEDCGYFVNGHMADISMRAKLRGLKNANGDPLFKQDLQGTTQYALDGSPMNFPNNGAFDKSKALMISGDFSQLVYSIRQDITFKLFSEGVVQNTDGTIAYNLMQNDMVALRAVMRLGWEIPNPINALKTDKNKRCPFAVLKAGAVLKTGE